MAFDLAKHAVLVSLNVSRPTMTRVDKQLTEEQRASHNVQGRRTIKTVKDLFGDELEDVEQAISQLRATHYKLTIPWVERGSALLVSKLYMQYTQAIREGISRINAMIQGLDYQAILTRRKIRLNGTFNLADYPDEHDFKQTYSVSFQVTPLPSTDQFGQLEDVVDYEVALAEADLHSRMIEAHTEAMKAVWQRVHDAVSRVHETLKDGSYQRIHDTLIGDIIDLANILPALNIERNPQLDRIAEELKRKLAPQQGQIESCKRPGADVHQKQIAADAKAILDMMSGYL